MGVRGEDEGEGTREEDREERKGTEGEGLKGQRNWQGQGGR